MAMTNLTNNLILLYTIVSRVYRTHEGKLTAYCWWTDGYIHIPISKEQRKQFIETPVNNHRYEVGHEQYFEPTGNTHIDGFKPEEDLKLETVMFDHILLRGEYANELKDDVATDRKITFRTKTDTVNQKQKEELWQRQNSEQTTTHQ